MRSLNEVFPSPTVKQVIFQIRFPNLFYMESKIGDLQLDVMQEFPESSLAIRRQILLADVGPDVKMQTLTDQVGSEGGRKVWQFSSPKGYKLNVLSDSLDITSEYHKTYDSPSSADRFRDVISSVMAAFTKRLAVPRITRVGLRYIDECPLPSRDTKTYREFYNSAFDLDRFPVEDSAELDFKVVIRRGRYSLRYVESLQRRPAGESFVILDFDAFCASLDAAEVLAVTDELHKITIEEWKRTIKSPVYDFMRRPQQGSPETHDQQS
jgi:uncharacterized protein (TIGR04255 family)